MSAGQTTSKQSLRRRAEAFLEPIQISSLSPEAWDRLETLEGLLREWSRAVRLVGFRSQEELDRRYFGEALAAAGAVPGEGLALDVGSGGGAPALPLAIVRPRVKWTLVESNGRKAAFLQEAVERLGLDAAVVVVARYEGWTARSAFDLITVRGVSLTPELRGKIRGDLSGGGRLLWFSSKSLLDEARTELGLPEDTVARLVPDAGFLLRVERAAL